MSDDRQKKPADPTLIEPDGTLTPPAHYKSRHELDTVLGEMRQGMVDGLRRFETDPEFRAEIKRRTA